MEVGTKEKLHNCSARSRRRNAKASDSRADVDGDTVFANVQEDCGQLETQYSTLLLNVFTNLQ